MSGGDCSGLGKSRKWIRYVTNTKDSNAQSVPHVGSPMSNMRLIGFHTGVIATWYSSEYIFGANGISSYICCVKKATAA